MSATRKTITIDGQPYCADVAGALPGNLTIANAVVGACHVDPPVNPGQPPAVIVGPDGLSRRLLRSASVTWGATAQGGTRVVSLMSWGEVFGRGRADDTPRPWPGVGGSAPCWRMAADEYVALAFRTPAAGGLTAQLINPSYIAGARPPLTMSISRIPGDFDPGAGGVPTPGSIRSNVPCSDANLVGMKFTPNAPDSWANLQPSTDYWCNILITNPRAVVTGKPITIGATRIG